MDRRTNHFRIIKNKLGSRSGESISETLVSLLISALALVLLAGVISASTRIVTTSRNTLNRYYDANNSMAQMNTGSNGTVTVTGGNLGSKQISEPVVYGVNGALASEAGEKKIIVYRKPKPETDENELQP